MNSIELMVEEHELIRRMLKVMRQVCLNVMNGEEICYEDFEYMIDFVKHYADAHHHGKEEQFLFKAMEEHLGALGHKLIRNGMLVEHDLGRLYMSELKAALERTKAGDMESKLDMIANAVSYTHLLERHIAKENDVVYSFGERQLSKAVMQSIHEQSQAFEEAARQLGIQEKYEMLVMKLERKYLV